MLTGKDVVVIIAGNMKSLFLNILLGVLMICGNQPQSLAGSEALDAPESMPLPDYSSHKGTRFSKRPWLYQWETIDDVNRCAEFLGKHGYNSKRINEEVIEKTLENFGIERKDGDQWDGLSKDDDRTWEALCVFTCASYSVANYVPFWDDIISSIIKGIVNCILFTFEEQQFDEAATPEDYIIRWAWLLFLSQTENKEGEKLVDGYKSYPISIAKELLEKSENKKMRKIAEKMLKKIDAAQTDTTSGSSTDSDGSSEGE